MAATGILSKGITLSYKKLEAFEEITDLQECPDLGGSSEQVEVTTLADGTRRYIKGIKDFGELAFTFLYDNSSETSNYRVCRGLEEAGKVVEWQVKFPDGTTFEFSGEPSTTISAASVNAALTFTLNISLNSDMKVTNPDA